MNDKKHSTIIITMTNLPLFEAIATLKFISIDRLIFVELEYEAIDRLLIG